MTSKEKILEFIVKYISDNGYPPTVREIGNGVGYIDGEYTDTIHYMIDDVCITIRVDAEKKE